MDYYRTLISDVLTVATVADIVATDHDHDNEAFRALAHHLHTAIATSVEGVLSESELESLAEDAAIAAVSRIAA